MKDFFFLSSEENGNSTVLYYVSCIILDLGYLSVPHAIKYIWKKTQFYFLKGLLQMIILDLRLNDILLLCYIWLRFSP